MEEVQRKCYHIIGKGKCFKLEREGGRGRGKGVGAASSGQFIQL